MQPYRCLALASLLLWGGCQAEQTVREDGAAAGKPGAEPDAAALAPRPAPTDTAEPPEAPAARDGGPAADGPPTDGGASDRAPEDARRDPSILPVLWIDVGGKTIGPDGKLPGKLKVIEEHDGTLAGIGSRRAVLETPIGIKVRGSSSASFPKKSYSLELRNAAGADTDLPLVALPPESDWVLHSCYADKTCMRNALAYALGRELGRYAPRARFVEMFLDGKYNGMYLLVEKIKRGKDRVALAKTTDADITGGYIFKLESGGQGTPADPIPRDWVSRESPRVYSYHYPAFDEITATQKAYLQDHLSKFEVTMKGAGWADGYRVWLDVPSWVDIALLQELGNNVDAYHKSVYIQKQSRTAGDRLVLGPPWDFDLAFGNADFREAHRTDTWAHDMNRFGTHPSPYTPPAMITRVPFWWQKLWSDRAFQRDLRCRWQELRKGALAVQSIEAKLEGFRKEMARAEPRDHALWKTIGVQLPTYNHFAGKTYDEDVEYLRTWMGRRLVWMDANLPGMCGIGADK